mgnify:CR=1 FL=1
MALGNISVICGPMYSGKSELLVQKVKRWTYAKHPVLLCTKDTRHGPGNLVTHDGRSMTSCYLESADELLGRDLSTVTVVGIDEGQFCGDSLVQVCLDLSAKHKIVIVSGLDMDYLERPFENMALLMGVAESVTKLTAVCMTCGDPATRSHRIICSTDRYLEGDKESYEALCRPCFLDRREDPIHKSFGSFEGRRADFP